MAARSIQNRMEAVGFSTGFDYLRIFLAFAVVLWHSVAVQNDPYVRSIALGPVIGPFQMMILPMFFALSGFLVTGSIERSKTIAGFATLRVIRIIPALSVEVLLSALILGPLMTTHSLPSYFTDPTFFSYFWNVVGYIHFSLPGVFTNNPLPDMVNFSLWTVPYELECYAILVVLVLIGLHKRPRSFFLVVIALTILAAIFLGIMYGMQGPFGVHGRLLVLAFLSGVAIHLLRDRIPFDGRLALISFALTFALLSFMPVRAFAMLPAAYCTIWIGLQNPPKIMGGDYSYGVYLFAFPIQQLFASVPQLSPWYINFALTIIPSLLYAAFSWHVVEKPILARKRVIVTWVERWLGHAQRKFRLRPS